MGLISNLKSVLRSQSRAQLEEAYLAQSTSQIDLEMRQREIDRGMGATKGAGYLHPRCAAAWVESQGGTHAELTEGLRKNTRDLSEEELDKLFAEV